MTEPQTPTAPETPVQTEEQRRPLSELAAEVYGREYQPAEGDAGGDGGDDAVAVPRAEDLGITLDEAYDRMQVGKDDAAAPAAAPEPAKPAPDPEPPADPGDDAAWSNEDVQALNVYQREAEAYNADFRRFIEIKQSLDINAIAATDKARAAMLRQQMTEAEKELKQRHDALSKTGQALVGKAQSRQQSKAQKQLAAERQKLDKALPDLDRDALRAYLAREGFSSAEVDAAYDHRLLVVAEKARRYDAMKAQGRGRVPKLRAGAGQRDADLGPQAFRDHQRRPASLAELQRQHKRIGTVETAHALLTAKRQAAQQQRSR
jgi:hypothetical protein